MQIGNEGLYVLKMLERIFADMSNVTEGLNALFAEVSRAHGGGHISDQTATRLHEEIHARRQRQAKVSDARSRPGFHIAPMIRVLKRNADSAPENLTPEAALHAAELARRSQRLILRRWLASVASIPADIKQHFTMSGLSVLSFIALKCRYGDRCDLPVNSIANIAQVSERTVQNTLRQAERMGFIEVQHRKRLPNVVRVASQVWRDWWARSHPHTENEKCLFSSKNLDPLLGAKTVRDTSVPAPKLAFEPTPVEATDVVVIEAPAPVRKRVVPVVVAKHRSKPVVETVDAHLDAVKAEVEEFAKARTADVSDADPWERPEPEAWMSGYDRSWLTKWEMVERLTPARYPQVFDQSGARIREDVLGWLRDRWGSAGTSFGFHRFQRPPSAADTRIGFRSRAHAVEFRLRWGGA